MAKDQTRTTIRLGELTATVDDFVKNSGGEFRNRSHFVTVALGKFLDERCDAEGNPLPEAKPGELNEDGTMDVKMPPVISAIIHAYADAHGMSYDSAASYLIGQAVLDHQKRDPFRALKDYSEGN